MRDPYLLLWTGLIFASIFWYGFLVFYLGIKAGREIHALLKALEAESTKRSGPRPK